MVWMILASLHSDYYSASIKQQDPYGRNQIERQYFAKYHIYRNRI
jgi:hypothetical protein